MVFLFYLSFFVCLQSPTGQALEAYEIHQEMAGTNKDMQSVF